VLNLTIYALSPAASNHPAAGRFVRTQKLFPGGGAGEAHSESGWPLILERLKANQNINDAVADILNFIALQRVRVPAARDAAEAIYAAGVAESQRALDAAGKLPPKPAAHSDILEKIQITVDHSSPFTPWLTCCEERSAC
jgi:hypothetical protein